MSALPPVGSLSPETVSSNQVSSPLTRLSTSPLETPATVGGPNKNAFVELINQANEDQIRSDQAVQDLVNGENQDVQQVVMQVVKAEMSFQVFMEVRNQIVESYNELMRMQF